MKNFPLADLLVIVLFTAVFLLLNNFGFKEILSDYILIVALIAYFTGKFVMKMQTRKNSHN